MGKFASASALKYIFNTMALCELYFKIVEHDVLNREKMLILKQFLFNS